MLGRYRPCPAGALALPRLPATKGAAFAGTWTDVHPLSCHTRRKEDATPEPDDHAPDDPS